MLFLPRESSANQQGLEIILSDILKGRLHSLLHFLSSHPQASEQEDLWLRILPLRMELDWLFERGELEGLILNPNDGEYSRILKSYFHFARRMGSASHGYYLKETEVLWGRYFGDLAALNVNTQDPLYINLKNYLDWSRYQPELKNQSMIAKIFWPFYQALKQNSSIPPAFLGESLKIILHLNPSHSQALTEQVERLVQRDKSSEALKLLRHSLQIEEGPEKIILDAGLIKLCLELSASLNSPQLLEDAKIIFGQSASSMDSLWWIEISNILRSKNLMIPALFFHLKGYSFQTSDRSRHLILRQILWSIGERTLAESLYSQYLERMEQLQIIIHVPKHLQNHFSIRYTGTQNYELCRESYLFFDWKPARGLQLIHQEHNRDSILFPDNSPHQILSYEGGRFRLQKCSWEPLDNEGKTEVFAGFELSLTPESIARITPFQFFGQQRAGREKKHLHPGI